MQQSFSKTKIAVTPDLGHDGEKPRHKQRAHEERRTAMSHAWPRVPPSARQLSPLSSERDPARQNRRHAGQTCTGPKVKHITPLSPPQAPLTENSSTAVGLSLREGRSLKERLRRSLASKASCKVLKTDSRRGLSGPGSSHLFRNQSKTGS